MWFENKKFANRAKAPGTWRRNLQSNVSTRGELDADKGKLVISFAVQASFVIVTEGKDEWESWWEWQKEEKAVGRHMHVDGKQKKIKRIRSCSCIAQKMKKMSSLQSFSAAGQLHDCGESDIKKESRKWVRLT